VIKTTVTLLQAQPGAFRQAYLITYLQLMFSLEKGGENPRQSELTKIIKESGGKVIISGECCYVTRITQPHQNVIFVFLAFLNLPCLFRVFFCRFSDRQKTGVISIGRRYFNARANKN